ncbi:hypothetical protein [Streptomyces chartreusis]
MASGASQALLAYIIGVGVANGAGVSLQVGVLLVSTALATLGV